MKCAVIGTNQGGIKEVITNNKNGLIVKETEKALYNGMDKLINDSYLRKNLSSNLYDTVLNKFSWDVTSDKILKDIEK